MADKDVNVKMSICPQCGNAIRVAIEYEMTHLDIAEFAREVFDNDLQVKTISLEEYSNSNIQMFCKIDCPKK